MGKRIYLVRHGEIEIKGKIYLGKTDVGLSAAGARQAVGLREYFTPKPIEKAYVSPLKRCRRTIDVILEYRNLEAIVVADLKEISLGSWEGRSFEYIKSHFPQEFKQRGEAIDTYAPPGGESFFQLQQRVMPVFEEIANTAVENILIVAHAGVNRVILSKLLGISLQKLLEIYQPYGCVNELTWDEACQRWEWNLMVKGETYEGCRL